MTWSGLKLTLGAVLLASAVAVGAPDRPGAPPEKKVYPLAKQDGVWWLGIGDMCAMTGAKYDGGQTTRVLEGEHGRIEIIIGVVSKDTPLKITVGEDTYQLKLEDVKLAKNGERVWDLAHGPRLIDGLPCASLEDLCHLLRLGEGEELDGQPTIVKDNVRYRLVKGEPKPFSGRFSLQAGGVPLGQWTIPPTLRPGGVLVTPARPSAGGYAEFNGLLYQTGREELRYLQPGRATPAPSSRLYGPVIPDRYSGRFGGEYAKGDQLFLSIVDVPGPARSVSAFRMNPATGRFPAGEAAVRGLEEALAAIEAHLKQANDEWAREGLLKAKEAIEKQLQEAKMNLEKAREELKKTP